MCRLGTASYGITGGFNLFAVDQPSPLVQPSFLRHSVVRFRSKKPSELTQYSPRFHQRHLVGKMTQRKDTIIDITSDSQVKSNMPHRSTPASLAFKNFFYIFLYLYITKITINLYIPHLKSPTNQTRRAA